MLEQLKRQRREGNTPASKRATVTSVANSHGVDRHFVAKFANCTIKDIPVEELKGPGAQPKKSPILQKDIDYITARLTLKY